ncbi:GNAT family N-acetyltransferase [uncultured Clostridium sp.]|uniref:GNAT family N-acetyltransferase n=1 Tax=uncultured Clostridium sp. TaxID=59620 RepID=UPI0025D41316|nr:GNAT family N-acetyltransferase [uncultured Clostridium sp.]
MIKIEKSNSRNEEFIKLIEGLDTNLRNKNGSGQNFYDKYNVLSDIDTVLIMKKDNKAIACGCFKEYDDVTVEIKRMYVVPSQRGKGYSREILKSLETWAVELGYKEAILETGRNQLEAIGLYKKSGYSIIENYGQYFGVKHSICFRKKL